jgi:hypothetical protein
MIKAIIFLIDFILLYLPFFPLSEAFYYGLAARMCFARLCFTAILLLAMQAIAYAPKG